MDKKYIFETKIMVRDYECDIEGIVNNANYMHYAEHTRHLFLNACGISFAELHRQGTDAVVARVSMRFIASLGCDDEFYSRMSLRREGIRYIFAHDFYRASDEKLCFSGEFQLVTLVHGRPALSKDYDEAFQGYIDSHSTD